MKIGHLFQALLVLAVSAKGARAQEDALPVLTSTVQIKKPACPRGYVLKGKVCVCGRQCPPGTRRKYKNRCPTNIRRHCLCKDGYRLKGSKCVEKYRFNPILTPFGPSVTEPFKTCKDLRSGISKALQLLADKTLDVQVNNGFCRSFGKGGGGGGGGGGDFAVDLPQAEAGDAADGAAGEGESSFETNNQVEGVDEADVVKSDGKYIFAAYGSEIVMMDLEGNVLDRETCQTQDSKFGTNVRSLLLDPASKTVTAIGSDFGSETVAHVYRYSRGTLRRRRRVTIPGRYTDARSIKNKAHVITSISIRTFTLTGALNRCNIKYRGLTDEEYEEAAFKEAKAVIGDLVLDILEQMGIERKNDDKCKNIVRISTMTDADSDSTETEEDRVLDVFGGNGLLQNFICVTSFDMTESGGGYRRSDIETAGAFVPTFNTEVFASQEFLVIAGRGYRRISASGATNIWAEYTYLISFEFQDNNCKVIPAAVGSVRGYLLNQFSMDFYDGILRVATTNRRRWGFLNGRWQLVSESSSQVTKLEFNGGIMSLVGQLTGLGTTETIFSVRFVRNRGYVVTFRQIDPLFVIDMDPKTPVVLGELKITGFSNFLQPIGDNDEYLLGIGQEADENTGRTLGLKISLFDVSDPSNPTEVQNHIVEGFSSSAAQFESKAFRYLPISKKLILPVRVFSRGVEEDFDGFTVFDVDVKTGIEPVGKVTHADKNRINNFSRFYCYSNANLEPRSLVFNGNLVTLKGHTVKYSKGLESLKPGWTIDLDEGRDSSTDRCYPYFFFGGPIDGIGGGRGVAIDVVEIP